MRWRRARSSSRIDHRERSIGGGTERRLRSNVEGICTRPNYAERVDAVLSSMEPATREMGQAPLQSIMSNRLSAIIAVTGFISPTPPILTGIGTLAWHGGSVR